MRVPTQPCEISPTSMHGQFKPRRCRTSCWACVPILSAREQGVILSSKLTFVVSASKSGNVSPKRRATGFEDMVFFAHEEGRAFRLKRDDLVASADLRHRVENITFSLGAGQCEKKTGATRNSPGCRAYPIVGQIRRQRSGAAAGSLWSTLRA